MKLIIHPGTWVVAKLGTAAAAQAALPLLQPPLHCLLGDEHGWTIVCATRHVEQLEDVVSVEKDWCCLQVDGVLEFSMVGILAELTQALASDGVSVYALSSFETDYLLVKQADLNTAISALTTRGHRIERRDV